MKTPWELMLSVIVKVLVCVSHEGLGSFVINFANNIFWHTIPQFNRAPLAQLVEHRAVTREVVSSTPAGPTLRVLK